MTAKRPGCGRFADDLAELALGTLTGRERAELLSHLEECPRCTEELERLSAAADSLLLAVPEAEPPVGFEVRVLERLAAEGRPVRVSPLRLGARRARTGHPGSPRARSGRRLIASVAAAAVLLGALGFGIGRVTDSPGKTGPSVALSDHVREATLLSTGHAHGAVYVYLGSPGWLFMTVDRIRSAGPVTCEVTTASGRTVSLGTFWLQSGDGAWASELPADLGRLRTARLSGSDGTVLASATFAA